jgi:hypothetical protein
MDIDVASTSTMNVNILPRLNISIQIDLPQSLRTHTQPVFVGQGSHSVDFPLNSDSAIYAYLLLIQIVAASRDDVVALYEEIQSSRKTIELYLEDIRSKLENGSGDLAEGSRATTTGTLGSKNSNRKIAGPLKHREPASTQLAVSVVTSSITTQLLNFRF